MGACDGTAPEIRQVAVAVAQVVFVAEFVELQVSELPFLGEWQLFDCFVVGGLILFHREPQILLVDGVGYRDGTGVLFGLVEGGLGDAQALLEIFHLRQQLRLAALDVELGLGEVGVYVVEMIFDILRVDLGDSLALLHAHAGFGEVSQRQSPTLIGRLQYGSGDVGETSGADRAGDSPGGIDHAAIDAGGGNDGRRCVPGLGLGAKKPRRPG